MRRIAFIFILQLAAVIGSHAQRAGYSKMSSLVRQAVLSENSRKRIANRNHSTRKITAFVRIKEGGEAVLADNGCGVLAKFGDIYITSIPLSRLNSLSVLDVVERIEAGKSCSLLMDTTNMIVGADKLHEGEGLHQAFTGKGVVMGMQDIGFDLTNPNFYDTSMTGTRIKRFWDQLSADTIGSSMYVGAEYVTSGEILACAHSRDGLLQLHGNHTLGIAAGTGYDTPYRGIAYESDICLVNNAVTQDTVFISDDDLYKYTSATDVLGFKYIFDYADEVGKPCVISFSEGSHQDFYGDNMLMYEALQSMVGPGRIIVASAGNEGQTKTYFRKERGKESAGTFVLGNNKYMYLKMKADAPFNIRMTIYNDAGESHEINIETNKILSAPDSLLADTLFIFDREYIVEAAGYHSCYDEQQMAYELYVETTRTFGLSQPASIEFIGCDADVEVYRGVGYFIENPANPSLTAGEYTHSIYSPGSASAVICVGATAYRTGLLLENGMWMDTDFGHNGELAYFSSVGPTVDERIKPDVVAPGVNVVSSYSSYFLEENPDKYNHSQVARSEFNGRVYPWNSDCGTSMSTPVVSGAIALWLQAVPTLSPEDIKGVLERTCKRYDSTLEYPNNYYGYGEIDVYRGLLDILGFSSIKGISAENPKSVGIKYETDHKLSLHFDCPPENPFTVTVYSLSGISVMKENLQPLSGNYSIDLSSLPQGVYAVQVSGCDKGVTGSALVRI